jgi:hypothetical protein
MTAGTKLSRVVPAHRSPEALTPPDVLQAPEQPVCQPVSAPPPALVPPAFASYPMWDTRGAPVLPFGRNPGLACESSVASNAIKRNDSGNDMDVGVLPQNVPDEGRVPTRNNSFEDVGRRNVGSPLAETLPIKPARRVASYSRLGEDARGAPVEASGVNGGRFPRHFMQEQYLRGVEEGAKAAQSRHWQPQGTESLDLRVDVFGGNRVVPSVSGTGVKSLVRKEVVRIPLERGERKEGKKRSADEATSHCSGEPEEEQPSKRRSPNARSPNFEPRGL